ncbi:MAG: histone H1 [Ignavibacteria bacterium]|nr:histone H1 [Ignavibacteria bacterium]MBK7254793.1 histone H1 [Ignavibacteria bacterium]MBK7447717.1 histone H1 [Ignavibacteria bacterium]MBK8384078.1 histone H1 [Ignavibacteria bacterium]MBK9405303.1 histone H1 [Ignavibacteria bacterium]
MEKFTHLNEILETMKTDIEKFYEKGQNAAGTRLRKSLNDLRKKAAEIRKEIQDERAKRKTEGK